MHAQSTFFHQGSDLFEDTDPFMKKIALDVRLLFFLIVFSFVTVIVL